MMARSMDRARLKLLLASLLFLLLAATAGALLAVSGKALVVVERGGASAAIENVIVDLEHADPGHVSWLPDAPAVRGSVDEGTRARLEDSYLRAWRQIELALARCSVEGLRTYFGPGPLAQLEAVVADAAASGCRTRRSDGAHRLRLTFVSADGGLVAVTDERHWYVDAVPVAGQGVRYLETVAARDIVMRLDDGNWRVAAWVQREADGEASVTSGPSEEASFVTRQGTHLVRDGRPWRPEGVNYYPADTPWRAFWREYDASAIDADLDRAGQLGFDAIRIFVPFGEGPERPSDEVLDKLEDLLVRASLRRMRVIVTLFDLDFDYRPAAWPAADRYLERLLTRFAGEPTILAWDLKNEPDLDDARMGRGLVDAWLRHVIASARRFDRQHLLTVGWSAPRWAGRLASELDIVSVHDYGDATALGERLGQAAEAAQDRPLLLTEYGASSWQSPLFPGGLGEDGQARHIAAVRRSTEALAVDAFAGRFVWSLTDFGLSAPAPDGVRAWQRGVQRSFGLLGLDGRPKAAAAVLRGATPGVGVGPSPFGLALALACLCGVLMGLLARWRRKLSSLGALALLVSHPGAYVLVGLALTIVAESLRLEPAWLPLLAGVGIASASLIALLAVTISAAVIGRVTGAIALRGPRPAASPAPSER